MVLGSLKVTLYLLFIYLYRQFSLSGSPNIKLFFFPSSYLKNNDLIWFNLFPAKFFCLWHTESTSWFRPLILETWLGFGTFFFFFQLQLNMKSSSFSEDFGAGFFACCPRCLIGNNLQRSSFMRSCSLILAPERTKSPFEKPDQSCECWSHFGIGFVVFQPAASEKIEIIPSPWC